MFHLNSSPNHYFRPTSIFMCDVFVFPKWCISTHFGDSANLATPFTQGFPIQNQCTFSRSESWVGRCMASNFTYQQMAAVYQLLWWCLVFFLRTFLVRLTNCINCTWHRSFSQLWARSSLLLPSSSNLGTLAFGFFFPWIQCFNLDKGDE